MTEQSAQGYKKNGLGLLDILVIMAESWKLLVFTPLIAGIFAGGLSFLWPKSYESVAIVRMTAGEVSLLLANPVLDHLIEKFNLLPEFDGVKEDARQYMVKKIQIKEDKKTGIVTIAATDAAPERAQEIINVAIESVLKELAPKGKFKSRVEEQILINERTISNLYDVVERLRKQIDKSDRNGVHVDAVITAYIKLNSELATRLSENIELKSSLEVQGDEVYIQHAGMPQRELSPYRRIIVLLAILTSGFALLLFVFVKKAIASAAHDPENNTNLELIRAAFGLRSIADKVDR